MTLPRRRFLQNALSLAATPVFAANDKAAPASQLTNANSTEVVIEPTLELPTITIRFGMRTSVSLLLIRLQRSKRYSATRQLPRSALRRRYACELR